MEMKFEFLLTQKCDSPIEQDSDFWVELFNKAQKKGKVLSCNLGDHTFNYALINSKDGYGEDKVALDGTSYEFTGKKVTQAIKRSQNQIGRSFSKDLNFVFESELPRPDFADYIGLHEHIENLSLYSHNKKHGEACKGELEEVFERDSEFVAEYSEFLVELENKVDDDKEGYFRGIFGFYPWIKTKNMTPKQIVKTYKESLDENCHLEELIETSHKSTYSKLAKSTFGLFDEDQNLILEVPFDAPDLSQAYFAFLDGKELEKSSKIFNLVVEDPKFNFETLLKIYSGMLDRQLFADAKDLSENQEVEKIKRSIKSSDFQQITYDKFKFALDNHQYEKAAELVQNCPIYGEGFEYRRYFGDLIKELRYTDAHGFAEKFEIDTGPVLRSNAGCLAPRLVEFNKPKEEYVINEDVLAKMEKLKEVFRDKISFDLKYIRKELISGKYRGNKVNQTSLNESNAISRVKTLLDLDK